MPGSASVSTAQPYEYGDPKSFALALPAFGDLYGIQTNVYCMTEPDAIYQQTVAVQASVAGVASLWSCWRWYDATFTELSTVTYWKVTPGLTWQEVSEYYQAPAGAAYVTFHWVAQSQHSAPVVVFLNLLHADTAYVCVGRLQRNTDHVGARVSIPASDPLPSDALWSATTTGSGVVTLLPPKLQPNPPAPPAYPWS